MKKNKNTKIKKNGNGSFAKIDFLLIFVLILIALVFRLYKINTPLADHHSWRQADTAAVARNFIKEGFNLLTPKFDDLSNIPSGKDNPQGYRMVEFPLYNAIFAFLYRYFPFFSLEIYGRLVSVLSSLIIIFIIYYLVYKEEGRLAAFFSSLIFSVMPFFVFYSRVILPEMTAVALALLSLLFFYLYQKKEKIKSLLLLFFGTFSFALALLIKPTTIFYSLPIVYLFIKKYNFEIIKKPAVYFFFFVSLTPFLIWRIWILNYPEGIPASEWLFFSVNTYRGVEPIFFKPAFFRWIFKERLAELILGNYLLVFFILGFLKRPKRSFLFFWLGLASIIYLFTFQGGNVQHDYYQIIILPALAILIGIGINFFLSEKVFFPILNWITTLIIILMSFFFSFYEVKNFYQYPQDLITTANIIKTLTKEDEKIITDRLGDTTLLYLSERRGYPAITDDLETLKKKGAQYLVTDKNELANELKNQYQLIFESNRIYIFKL